MKKNTWKKIIPWALLLAVTGALIILPMSVRSKAEQPAYEFVSAQAERRDISSSLSGGGTVGAQEKQDVSLPDGVEITRYLVSNGENVEAGQPVAEVDSLTVLAAIARVRKSLETLEKNLNELSKSGNTRSIKCVADGRVKAVYAANGDDVRSVIIDRGSLGVLSLDGLMCAEVACDSALRTGDAVTVKYADGKEYPGKVASSANGILSVTLTDDGPEIGDLVAVYDLNGTLLGGGALRVNSPWTVLSSDGIVDSMNMKPGALVRKDFVLVTLKDTGATRREDWSRKHREYEDLLQELLNMLRSCEITAPCSGFVSGVDKSKATGLGTGTEHGLSFLAYYEDEGNDPSPPVADMYTVVLVTTVNGTICLGKTTIVPGSLIQFSPDGQTLTPESQQALLDYVSTTMEYIPESILAISGANPGDLFLIRPDAAIKVMENVNVPTPDINFGGFAASQKQDPEMFPTDESVILSVTPDTEMSITISVDELDILQYRVGMPAEISIDALAGEQFTGTVTKIAAVGTNSGGSSKFEVTVSLPYSERILPGMNASVVIRTGSTGMVVTVPAAALQDSGSKCVVYTGVDGKNGVLTGPVTVETGASDGEYVEILSGLTEGQTVWYKSYNKTA